MGARSTIAAAAAERRRAGTARRMRELRAREKDADAVTRYYGLYLPDRLVAIVLEMNGMPSTNHSDAVRNLTTLVHDHLLNVTRHSRPDDDLAREAQEVLKRFEPKGCIK